MAILPLKTFTKDPAEVLDYSMDWAGWLKGDTIATSTWTSDAGITRVTDVNSSSSATVWVSGGTDGTTYNLTNTITTVGGATAKRTMAIQVRYR